MEPGTCIDTFPMLAANPRRWGLTILMFNALRAPVVPRLYMARSMYKPRGKTEAGRERQRDQQRKPNDPHGDHSPHHAEPPRRPAGRNGRHSGHQKTACRKRSDLGRSIAEAHREPIGDQWSGCADARSIQQVRDHEA